MTFRTISTAAVAATVTAGLVLAVGGVAAGDALRKDPRGSDVVETVQRELGGSAGVAAGVAGLAVTETAIGKGTLRLSGADRYETSVAVSRAGWDETNTDVVFLANGQTFPDALSMGASTGGSGPLLLTRPDVLPGVVEAEIARLRPCFVVVVGGRGAVSDAVATKADQYTDPTLCPEPASPTTAPTATSTATASPTTTATSAG